MELTIFAKKRQTTDGRTFFTYLSTMTRKDGTKLPVAVKFREDAGNPKPENCPMNILVDKTDANLASKDYGVNEETGEVLTSHTLWVSKWSKGSEYVDHSLDDFE